MAVARRIPIGMGLTAPSPKKAAVPKLPAMKVPQVGAGPASPTWVPGAPAQTTRGEIPQFSLPTLEGLIQSSPTFAATYSGLKGDLASALAQRQAGVRTAWSEYGDIPDFEKAGKDLGLTSQHMDWLRSDLTPEVRDLAAKMSAQGLSTTAKLQKAQDIETAQRRAELATRGIVGSGAASKYTRETAQKFQDARSVAERNLMKSTSDIYGGYGANEVENARRIADAQMAAAKEAYDRWWNEVGQYGSEETTTPEGQGYWDYGQPGQPAPQMTWNAQQASGMPSRAPARGVPQNVSYGSRGPVFTPAKPKAAPKPPKPPPKPTPKQVSRTVLGGRR